MFVSNLHKWLFSLVVMATLALPSYATTTNLNTTNTEWVVNKPINNVASVYCLENTKPIAIQYSFYNYDFRGFVKHNETNNYFIFLKQDVIFNHFKTTRLYTILKPQHTNTVII